MNMSGDTSPAFEEFAPRRPFTGLFSTTRDVLLSPRRFFSGMPPDGPARWPLAYLLACYLISATLGVYVIALLLFPVVGLAVLFAPPSPTELTNTVVEVLTLALFGVLALGGLYLVSVLLFFLRGWRVGAKTLSRSSRLPPGRPERRLDRLPRRGPGDHVLPEVPAFQDHHGPPDLPGKPYLRKGPVFTTDGDYDICGAHHSQVPRLPRSRRHRVR